MCKKFFHPTNFENIKRKWMAEQANEYDTKREAEKLDQYRREQETLENRVLLGDEKARLGLAWMYDQPAMMDKVIFAFHAWFISTNLFIDVPFFTISCCLGSSLSGFGCL